MIEKIFDRPVALLVAAIGWFSLCSVGALVGANALHLLKTPIDWLISVVVGICFGIVTPLVAHAVAEATLDGESGRRFAEFQEYLERIRK